MQNFYGAQAVEEEYINDSFNRKKNYVRPESQCNISGTEF